MKFAPRRLTFQLVSLFDLLIIIVFAQYYDLRDRTLAEVQSIADAGNRAETRAGDRMLDSAAVREVLHDEVARLMEENETLKELNTVRDFETAEELRRTQDELRKLAALTADLFGIPQEELDKLLQTRTPEETEKIRESLKKLTSNRGAAAVRNILTLAELEKRCDLWELHIGDDNVITFKSGDHTARFRADTAEKFEVELFKQYKALPQPKSLVLMLVSWGDSELGTRAAAVNGLERTSERMRADSDRRSRFEYAILGYIPTMQAN